MYDPPQELKAIQTVYDGHHFRSRLEARWAVFFNAMRIPYNYEAEGFDLNGLYYLPDFWLPEQKFFIEIKGPFTDNEGERKARALAAASRRMVYMFHGIPKIDSFGGFDDTAEATAYYPDGEDYDYMWCKKPCCGELGIEFNGRSERIICNCPPELTDKLHKTITYDHASLVVAFMAARHHRFDGGK